MAEYFQGEPIHEGRLGLLPAAFNPPTRAHVALADAARRAHGLDQVTFVLPQVLPHKQFDDTRFEQRLSLVRAAVGQQAGFAAGKAEGGLFCEIAAEFRRLCGPRVEVFVLCGRDAAARIVHWDYGAGPDIGEQLREFRMLVAAREGDYEPPPELAQRILPVDLAGEFQRLSSSEVREAIAHGRPWRHMVPADVARVIESLSLYRGGSR